MKSAQEPSDLKDRLRSEIVRGVFAPSQPLRMEALKARYDTGFSPIREALSRLVAEGLVELEPNRGFRVAALNREDLFDIALARIAVETAAIRRAIELGDHHWEADLIGALHRYKRLAPTAFKSETALADWEQAHDGLHRAMISACGSPRLLMMQARYQEQHLRYRRLIVLPEVACDDHTREHEQLVEVVLSRDADRAAATIERHMMITVDALANANFWNP